MLSKHADFKVESPLTKGFIDFCEENAELSYDSLYYSYLLALPANMIAYLLKERQIEDGKIQLLITGLKAFLLVQLAGAQPERTIGLPAASFLLTKIIGPICRNERFADNLATLSIFIGAGYFFGPTAILNMGAGSIGNWLGKISFFACKQIADDTSLILDYMATPLMTTLG